MTNLLMLKNQVNNLGIFFFLFLFSFLSPVLAKEAVYQIAPTALPHTQRSMKTSGFWVSRHPLSDQVILTSEEIKAFNSKIQNELKLTKDIPQFPNPYSGEDLRNSLEETLKDFSSQELYGADDRRANKEFFTKMREKMNVENILAENLPQYGFIVHFADQRIFPTQEPLYAKSGDIDFDELQNSDLDVGTPVAILHKSEDNRWLYVMTYNSDGWIEADRVAFCPLEEIQSFLKQESFVIVTQAKADIFLNLEMTKYYDYARMGSKFIKGQILEKGTIEIRLPRRDDEGQLFWQTAYVYEQDISQGYLTYTPRHILQQAFKLLNEPYGWGGMHGEQDCSRFLLEVFSTVGIELPRNSKEQAQVGTRLTEFDEQIDPNARRQALKEKAMGATTILPLKGHIMLYLGIVDEVPYAIHATWAYRERQGSKDVPRVINRVVVSDLTLGEGTKKGSLLDRLNSVVIIGK